MNSLTLLVSRSGEICGLYHDQIPWRQFGPCAIRRASHVEPTETGDWLADLSPVNGPLLGPFTTRIEALAAEQEWLSEHLAQVTQV